MFNARTEETLSSGPLMASSHSLQKSGTLLNKQLNGNT